MRQRASRSYPLLLNHLRPLPEQGRRVIIGGQPLAPPRAISARAPRLPTV